ncbi:hypothetical protein [Shimazuella kribbensis]|nr:hypothetical protein [Shimazuella kribbensis]
MSLQHDDVVFGAVHPIEKEVSKLKEDIKARKAKTKKPDQR